MSALGQKQTCAAQKVMSALPPKADMCSATRYVRFVPKADIRISIPFLNFIQWKSKRQVYCNPALRMPSMNFAIGAAV